MCPTIVRSLYRLKSVGALFRAPLAQCMQQLGSCDSEPDLWMKADYRSKDKVEHYI